MAIRKDEEYFPRGRSSSKKPALRKSKDTLFKKHKKLKKKKNSFYEENKSKGLAKKTKSIEDVLIQHKIKSLTYQSLEEGMVVLGRVREILAYHMHVCLPGRLSAKVTVAGISTPYTNTLAEFHDPDSQQTCPRLSELFQVGEIVACTVVEIKKEGTVLAVSASLEPSLVNKELSRTGLSAGRTLVAAVQSVEDHGFTLHTGVPSLTVFLPTRNTTTYVQQHNQGRPIAVGEVVRCLLTRCVVGRSVTRAEATLEPRAVGKAVLTNPSAQDLQPGTTLHCTVDQVLNAGLVVSVGSSKGYIDATQLTQCWTKPKDYQPGSQLTATVLYSLPHADFQSTAASPPTYLTLRSVSDVVRPSIPLGEAVRASVTFSCFRGIYLCLGDKKDNELCNKGFVSVRRLGEMIEKDEIPKKFPRGKILTARILAYDYMELVYNCSLEREKLFQHFTKLDQLTAGDRVTCQVNSIESERLMLGLGSITLYVAKAHSADKAYSNLYQHFSIGDVVDARVLSANTDTRQVTATLKETLICSPALTSYEAAVMGDGYWGTVRHVNTNSLFVDFYNDVHGLVIATGVSRKGYIAGQLVKSYVTYVNVQKEKLTLTLTANDSRPTPQLIVGEQYQLVVTAVNADHWTVSACDYDSVEGIVPIIHLRDCNVYREGDFLKAWLYSKKEAKYHFSPNPAIKKFLEPNKNISPLSRLTCCVAKVEGKKITVYTSLPEFPVVEIPKTKWPKDRKLEVYQLLEVCVEEIDVNKQSITLTCRQPSPLVTKDLDVNKNAPASLTEDLSIPSLNKGENEVNGLTKKKSRKRKFSSSFENPSDLETNKQNLRVKKHKGEDQGESNNLNLVEDKINDQAEKNSKKKNNIAITTECEEAQLKSIPSNKTLPLKKNKQIQKTSQVLKTSTQVNQISESVNDETSTSKKKKKSKGNEGDVEENNIKKATLAEAGFMWDIKLEDLNTTVDEPVEDDVEDVDEGTKGKKKKTAAERRKSAKEEEARLREVEKTLLDSETNPQTVGQFDRAVLARPDDADLWIKYMTHHLQATEIEKARSVARRALHTINQRHEVERLNVWIALLNLENLFGTQESLKNSLDEAVRTNDEFTVYCKMLTIYTQSNKSQEAEQLVNTLVRKFRSSLECWVQSLSALMAAGLADKARALLQRAITALPSKQHVNLLCKFALLENQYGFGEQSETLFEHILTSYPKRTDVWNVYVDMLVKFNKMDSARQILERATRQKLPPRNMKMLFSKWITFEEKHGTPERVEHVRKQALSYVNNITTKLE